MLPAITSANCDLVSSQNATVVGTGSRGTDLARRGAFHERGDDIEVGRHDDSAETAVDPGTVPRKCNIYVFSRW